MLVTLFAAATQAFNVAIPESGLPRILFDVFLLCSALHASASPVAFASRSLLVIFGSAFVLVHRAGGAVGSAGGWLKRVLQSVLRPDARHAQTVFADHWLSPSSR